MLGWEPRRWKRDFIKRSRIAVSERTTFRGRGELGTFATRGPSRFVLRMIITSPGGTICLITFDRSSISWRVSNEPVSARVSASPWTIKHWSLGTLGFCCGGSEGDFSAELLLRRFPCTSRHGPSDAMGSGWPRVRGWSSWATDVDGFEKCDGEIGIGLSVGRGVRLTSGESCLWAAADFAGFFLKS